MSKNLIEQIHDEIETDEESYNSRENNLLDIYYNADNAMKTLINDAFIALCGFSLGTLIDSNPKFWV